MSDAQVSLRDQMQFVAGVVRDAGGEIVGRTKLQKSVFFLKLAGFEVPFRFGYKHYGPYSEAFAEAVELAAAVDLISERQQSASWGGTYSVYSAAPIGDAAPNPRVQLLREAVNSDAVLLELAATAGYLAQEGSAEPWAETARRKPDKSADGRLRHAKDLYRRLREASRGTLPESLSANIMFECIAFAA
jgi:hypothetical protein